MLLAGSKPYQEYNTNPNTYRGTTKTNEKLTNSRQQSKTSLLHELSPEKVEEIQERRIYKQAMAKMHLDVRPNNNRKQLMQTDYLQKNLTNIHRNFDEKNK